jgi:hypothetical protein
MNENKYQKEYSMKFSSVFAYLILFYVFTAMLTAIYNKVWDTDNSLLVNKRLFFLFSLIIGIIVHELIHGIFAAIFSPNGFKNIKFGFSFRSFIAYCSIKENMKVKHFKVIAIMPFIILGALPLFISFIYGYDILFDFGIILSLGSIGDLIMFIWLCNEKNNYWVKNEKFNPKRLEIVVFEK